MDEFIVLIERLCANSSYLPRYAIVAYFVFQIHMIAWLDNVMNFMMEDIIPNPEYPGPLK